ncbi:unnamed protein product [Didymodactylos carnosus]|uniref:ETS domain-containing protein n=1 Tax=Didymodactylos carnosus TaxID=1234261 RepID=A0A8S2FX98_9BILA|nr:unnamed protein product [Didymodactylos carnosus]CAF4380850.1 unnamed protein product [Didymodactylos carnosus]
MSVEHHVMSLHDSMNTNNVNRVPPTTVNSLKTLSGKEMNQLYETVSILTNDIEVIQNKCVNINEKILKLKNELNESHEQFSKAKQQMNAMNYMRLNQELLQQEITLWQNVKGRYTVRNMTYDKMARALRLYYKSGIMTPVNGRYTFQFGPQSGFNTSWIPKLNAHKSLTYSTNHPISNAK